MVFSRPVFLTTAVEKDGRTDGTKHGIEKELHAADRSGPALCHTRRKVPGAIATGNFLRCGTGCGGRREPFQIGSYVNLDPDYILWSDFSLWRWPIALLAVRPIQGSRHPRYDARRSEQGG